MTVKKWIVNLSDEEREVLGGVIKKGKVGAEDEPSTHSAVGRRKPEG